MLRSSSTPLLGSLLCSIAESPNHDAYGVAPSMKHYNTTVPHPNKISFHPSPGSIHFSCNSSPSIADFNGGGFRRAQSDGNLEGLAYASCDGNDEFHQESVPMPKKVSRQKGFGLETIPSFSCYNSRARCEEEEEEEEEEDREDEENLGVMMNTYGHEKNPIKMENMVLGGDEVNVINRNWNGDVEKEMFLAKGLGIGYGIGGSIGTIGGRGGGGGGGGREFNKSGAGGDDGGGHGVEEYYKRMVDQNPGDPLFLRNYAQFLYETKHDLPGAEEYYSRAILADPHDGEVMSRYAELVWELHHDESRALAYFERAVQASPQDSHVHAAYANFLWDTEEDDSECHGSFNMESKHQEIHEGAIANA